MNKRFVSKTVRREMLDGSNRPLGSDTRALVSWPSRKRILHLMR
jgi:hypothetical protein